MMIRQISYEQHWQAYESESSGMAPLAGRVKTSLKAARAVVNAAPTSQSYDFQTACGAKL
ncbi:MAG: hypothetical protein ABJO88_17990 [Parasphingorhabdus sp.]